LNHRSEIDGLRALAVIPVVLFHAGFENFSGGFVGVDVFFVISGYLITSLIMDELANNCFSLKEFYERRSRRLLPALFFIAIITIPLSVIYLPPDELKDYFQSLAAISIFASNILFWKESGYFDIEASQKPLLHTWSLSVEAQFYLLFPLFLVFAWRFRPKHIFFMIFGMAILSLMLSEWAWRYSPNANFYFISSRAWELFSGSLCALVLRDNKIKPSNIFSLLGLAAITVSIFVYDQTTPFPSIYSLLPILGCMLVILFAGPDTATAKILCSRPLVSIGLMSYSVYLLHHPLFAFSRMTHLEELTPLFKCFLVASTFFLAFFIWKYIEKPFRKPVHTPQIYFFSAALLITFSLFTLGFLYHVNIIPQKKTQLYWASTVQEMPQKFRGIVIDGLNCSDRDPKNACLIGDGINRIVIAGDSHARVLTEVAYRRHAAENFQLIDLTASGCPFLIGLSLYHNQRSIQTCSDEYQLNRMEFLRSISPSVVILHSRFPLYMHGAGFDNTVGGIEPFKPYHVGVNGSETVYQRSKLIQTSFLQTVKTVLDYGHRVIIVTAIPTNGWHPIKRLNKILLNNPNSETEFVRQKLAIPREAVEKRHAEINSIIALAVSQFPELKIIDSSQILCDDEFCHAMTSNRKILYSDRDHLSLAGAELIFSAIKNLNL
jgi:peptidoglycan/LPS O-acetylase OafA/YrhL